STDPANTEHYTLSLHDALPILVVNDRWGKDTRQKHGGYYTTEYNVDSKFSHPWEECRGMGFSFGYNRNEDIENYNSPKALILTLDRKSTRLNSSHVKISYAVFC